MKFSIGSVMGRGWKVLMSEFLALLVMSGIFYVPLMILSAILLSDIESAVTVNAQGGAEISSSFWLLTSVLTVLGVLAGFMLQAAVTFTVFQRLRNRDVSIGDALSVGMARLFPVLGVSIVVGLLIGLGTIALILPGIILACVLFVAVPAAVVENPGVFGALARSAELTRGKRFSLFALALIFGIIGWVANKAVENVMTADQIVVMSIVTMGVAMLVSLYQSVCVVVAYHDLRVEKEGIDTEEIAAVFD